MSDRQKFIAEFAAQLAAKPNQAPPAEEKVVIRPAGAAPAGVRVSPTLANPPVQTAAAPQQAAARPAAKAAANAKAKAGKPRKPVSTRPPLMARLRAGMKDFRFRLLPLTIFVAVLMLGLRVGDVWRVATRDAALPDFPVSLAQGPQTQAPAKPANPTAASPTAANPTKDTAPKAAPLPAQGGMNVASAAAPNAAPAAAPGAGATAPLAPLGPIDNQELLQHFADRRAEIERRTKEMEQREALLAAAEKRIDQKVAEMEKVRADIQKLMNQGDEKQSAQLESLVKIYETMKPKEAARIFEELDMPVLLGVIQKMKEQKTAPILAAMDPTKAKEVTAALIERRVPMKAN